MEFPKTVALISLLALVGCKKAKEAPPVSSESVPQSIAANAPAESSPALVPSPYIASQAENSVQAGVAGVADPFLTSQLRIFVKTKGRMPVSFTEFVRARLDSVPPAPQRCKWVIDSSTSEIKAVKK